MNNARRDRFKEKPDKAKNDESHYTDDDELLDPSNPLSPLSPFGPFGINSDSDYSIW